MGRVSGVYGVRGWVRVHSFTEPRENILAYSPWRLRSGEAQMTARVRAGRGHGQGVIAALDIADDRDQAGALVGAEIRVARTQLPPPEPGRYYRVDLLGLRVVSARGETLGHVEHLLETGANDVMVVRGERERLVPFIDSVVLEVSLDAGLIRVDWDPEF